MEYSGLSKVALVTGAGSGIGRTVALALYGAGYHVVLAGRRREELERTAASVRTHPGLAMLVVPTDVSDPKSVGGLFNELQGQHGRLDLLFNNAGTNVPGVPIEDLTMEQWNAVVNVNLTGSFLCAQAAIKVMKNQAPRGGRIINNGSVSAHAPRPHSAPYTASKHAITGLTKSISLDCRQYNIACGQIDIGNATTEMASGIAKGTLQADGTTMAEPTMEPQHVAEAVLYMASLPLHVNVQFITVMATRMPYVGRG